MTGYHIERCQGAGCTNFAQIATVTGSTLSYSDTGLSRLDQLQLPGARQRRRRQPRPLQQHRERHNECRFDGGLG